MSGPIALVALVALVVLGACSTQTTNGAPPVEEPRPTPEPVARAETRRTDVVPDEPAPSTAGPCAGVTDPETLTLAQAGYFVSATGLGVRLEGASHDAYDDGTTDVLLTLTLWQSGAQSRSWMPSALAAPRYETFFDHCVRVREASETRVVLEVAPIPSDARAAAPIAACPTAPTATHLDDYAQATDGARYWVDVTRVPTTGEWLPTPLPRMPRHHASRLELRNLAAHPALARAAARAGGQAMTLRFVFDLLAHHIESVSSQHQWRGTYEASVVDVCLPPPAPTGVGRRDPR
jgi:hypothetical protein